MSKGKLKVISLYRELTSLRRLESESITDYIIMDREYFQCSERSRGSYKGQPSDCNGAQGITSKFEAFYNSYNPKEENLVFSPEFNVCLRSYEETVCYTPDESNNTFQMKTTFKKINPKNKLWVSTHSRNDYKSKIIITTNTRNLSIVERTIKFPPPRQILFVTFVREGGHKAFECKNQRQRDFVII